MTDIDCVLLDIEGTICPISFVKDTLFPYAIQALPSVLAERWDAPDFIPYREAFPPEHATSPAALQAHVEDLSARDVKIAYLKNLQGYLWEDGYRTGAYATPLFPDIVPALRKWKETCGKSLVIYSSGSIKAQQLLFRHVRVSSGEKNELSSGGKAVAKVEDLTGLIHDWFDTVNAGSKQSAQSYTMISGALNLPPSSILFLSDNVGEIDAAMAAGMQAIVLDRPGNAPLSEDDRNRLRVVSTLANVTLSR